MSPTVAETGLLLAPRSDRLIVLLTGDLTSWARSEAAYGANVAARRLGYPLISLDWRGQAAWEKEYLSAILERQPAGLLILSPIETKNLRLCQRVVAQVPTVQLFMPHPNLQCDCVMQDTYGAVKLAVEHLVELGHRRIGHITYRLNIPPVDQRVQAYRDALKEAGLPHMEGWILRLPGYWIEQAEEDRRRRSLLRRYLEKPERPVAVFAFNDCLAMELICAAWEAGLAPPRDLAVVGCGDLFNYALTGIPLTTVHDDFRRMGSMAVERLVARIRKELTGPPAEVQVAKPQLIVRESSTGTLSVEEPWGRVRDYLEKNFRRPLRTREVASVACLNHQYFSKRFPKVFGQKFTSYMRALRMQYARELLLTTNLTVEDIALQSGFPDPNYFFRLFKELHGTTPQQYREVSFLQ